MIKCQRTLQHPHVFWLKLGLQRLSKGEGGGRHSRHNACVRLGKAQQFSTNTPMACVRAQNLPQEPPSAIDKPTETRKISYPPPIKMCSDLQLMWGTSTFAVRDCFHFFQVLLKKGWYANKAIVGYYRAVPFLRERNDFAPFHFTRKDAVWIYGLILVVGIPEIPCACGEYHLLFSGLQWCHKIPELWLGTTKTRLGQTR